MPYNNTFSIILGQSANKSWENVNFIWVPQGTHSPSAGKICPALNSNTATSGLSCGSPGSISFANNATVNETFYFNPRPLEGVFYGGNFYAGEIWAEYQNVSGSSWQTAKIAYVIVRELPQIIS